MIFLFDDSSKWNWCTIRENFLKVLRTCPPITFSLLFSIFLFPIEEKAVFKSYTLFQMSHWLKSLQQSCILSRKDLIMLLISSPYQNVGSVWASFCSLDVIRATGWLHLVCGIRVTLTIRTVFVDYCILYNDCAKHSK